MRADPCGPQSGEGAQPVFWLPGSGIVVTWYLAGASSVVPTALSGLRPPGDQPTRGLSGSTAGTISRTITDFAQLQLLVLWPGEWSTRGRVPSDRPGRPSPGS